MSGGAQNDSQAKKMEYMQKLIKMMEEYPRVVLVTCDNIGSTHMQRIRISLRGRGVLLMGKNTLMRKAIKMSKEAHPEWQDLAGAIKGNVGLVFTHEPLPSIQPKLLESRVPASAKIGIVAPQDVVLPAQVTTLEPTKTNFFAALDIATKITRGCVEILNDVKLCTEGKKVGGSEAALLQMLDMRPFTYGLKLTTCYDEGIVFDAKMLRVNQADVYKAFSTGIARVAGLSLAIHYPSLPAFPHVVSSGFRRMLALTFVTSHTFKQAEGLKSAVATPVAPAPVVVPPKQEEKKVEAKPAAKPPPKKETSTDPEEFADIFS